MLGFRVLGLPVCKECLEQRLNSSDQQIVNEMRALREEFERQRLEDLKQGWAGDYGD